MQSYSIDMREISKPRRKANTITKGRKEEANSYEKWQENLPKFQRLVTLQKTIGIRRNELAKLKREDIKQINGFIYIHVLKGKGGKSTYQLVLPKDEKIVKKIFFEKSIGENIFTTEEMNNKINLLALRRYHGWDSYNFFKEKLDNNIEYKRKLKAELIWFFEYGI